jgi:hypothetical protein
MSAWVACSERLPDSLDSYYVWDGEGVLVAYWCGGDETPHWEDPELGDRGGGTIANVTHWYPYPEPPTAEGDAARTRRRQRIEASGILRPYDPEFDCRTCNNTGRISSEKWGGQVPCGMCERYFRAQSMSRTYCPNITLCNEGVYPVTRCETCVNPSPSTFSSIPKE